MYTVCRGKRGCVRYPVDCHPNSAEAPCTAYVDTYLAVPEGVPVESCNPGHYELKLRMSVKKEGERGHMRYVALVLTKDRMLSKPPASGVTGNFMVVCHKFGVCVLYNYVEGTLNNKCIKCLT